jgi:thymidine kinase
MEMFTSVFEPLIVASILIVGGGLFTFFRKMSKTQRELCETVQQLRRTLIILAKAVDSFDVPVLCYGIRTDFRGELFPGSQHLLAWADNLIELKTICHCGSKATMVVRIDENGNVIEDGDQVVIGGNDRYQSMCRKHFAEHIWKS